MDIYNNDNCNIMMQQDAAIELTKMYLNMNAKDYITYNEDKIYRIYKDFKDKIIADGLDKNTFMGSI